MISLVLNRVLSTPTMPAHNAPAAAPAMIINGITALPSSSPSARPNQLPAIAPITNWPSPPMLNTPIRNAIAAARPVNSSGVAAMIVADQRVRPSRRRGRRSGCRCPTTSLPLTKIRTAPASRAASDRAERHGPAEPARRGQAAFEADHAPPPISRPMRVDELVRRRSCSTRSRRRPRRRCGPRRSRGSGRRGRSPPPAPR